MGLRWNKHLLTGTLDGHIIDYPTPKNLNYMWSFGASAGICLGIQMVTGIFLSMHYSPKIELAFFSIEHIMRNIKYGWWVRYVHANGASMFFIVVYSHIFRGIYYGSYMYPRHYLWLSGALIFLLMMATAFLGYVLPWGQMSYWGATVITYLVTTIPYVGFHIVEWVWGGYVIGNPTLTRFYSFHYILPFVIAGLVIVHIALLHDIGSNNPLGVEYYGDKIPFYPYFYVKDLFSLVIFLIVFSVFLYFFPNFLNHSVNYIPADSIKTPAHIVPEWYFLPFYAMLRAIPHKLGGILTMFGAVALLFVLPFLNTSRIRSTGFRPFYVTAFWLFFLDFVSLALLGVQRMEEPFSTLSILATVFYFFFFLVLVPLSGDLEEKLMRYDVEKI